MVSTSSCRLILVHVRIVAVAALAMVALTSQRSSAAPGSLDPSFAGSGIASFDSPPDPYGHVPDTGTDVIVQADGKVVVAGNVQGNNGGSNILLVRWNADGTLDTGFGVGGAVRTYIDNGDRAYTILEQPDDHKLVVAGSSFEDFAILRYNTDGSLDLGFGSAGITLTNLGGYDAALDMALQSDGKIVAVGYTQSAGYGLAVVRYNSDGSLDTSFATNGKYVNGTLEGTQSVIIQGDQKIVVGGSRDNGCAPCGTFGLLRLTTTGILDTTFGTNGMVFAPFDYNSRIQRLVQQPGGEIVAVGGVGFGYESSGRMGLARFSPSGVLDPSFGSGGQLSLDLSTGFDEAYDVVVEPAGAIVFAGLATPGGGAILVKLTSAGALDTTFGTDGIVRFDGEAYGLTQQADGRLLVSGKSYTGGGDITAWRFFDNVCGNSTQEPGEQCDDSNIADGDGCDSNCTVTACGNGIVTAGEECDDANMDETDGCLSTCHLTPTMTPTSTETSTMTPTSTPTETPTITPTRTPTPGCGDGVIQPGEECDDSNLIDGDCCSSACQLVHHPDCMDNFFCYGAKTTSKTSKFIPAVGVSLEDQFRASVADVTKPERLCAPANVQGEDATAPSHADHLMGFKHKPTSKFTGAPSQLIKDRFGSLLVNVSKPVGVLVPSAKSLVAPPASPVTTLDSFQCYKVKAVGEFIPRPGYTIQDQFGSLTVDVKKPARLCAPMDINGTIPGAEAHPNHLMCYAVKQTSEPKFAKVSPVYVNHRFGSGTIDVTKVKELCVPAFVNPSCGNGILDPGEQCEGGPCCTASCQFAAAGTPCTDDGNPCTSDVCHDSGTCGFDTCLYTFSGVATDLPTSTLTSNGWTQCYSEVYGNGGKLLSTLLSACNQANLLMACRQTGSPILITAAHAPRADVTFDVGPGNTPHDANGVGWYFNTVPFNNGSWGFAPQGDPVNRNPCDLVASSFQGGTDGDKRLCWHTYGTQLNVGWRCGTNDSLNSSTAFERVIFQAP